MIALTQSDYADVSMLVLVDEQGYLVTPEIWLRLLYAELVESQVFYLRPEEQFIQPVVVDVDEALSTKLIEYGNDEQDDYGYVSYETVTLKPTTY